MNDEKETPTLGNIFMLGLESVRSVYAKTCELRSQIEDKRLFWELLKMEIRAATITYAKSKAKRNHNKENEIKRQLDELDNLTLVG